MGAWVLCSIIRAKTLGVWSRFEVDRHSPYKLQYNFSSTVQYTVYIFRRSGQVPTHRQYSMYVCMVITCSKGEDQPGKVANPARGQLNRENGYFSVPVRA